MEFKRQIQRKIALETRRLTSGLRIKPNTLIIGAQKAGTTSLHDYLEQHPETNAPLKKEVHFFTDNYNKGIGWYHGHFPLIVQDNDSKVILESTPNYILAPHIPQRVYDYNPDIKIIVLLRHPVHRAYSQYAMNLRLAHIDESLSFAEAIVQEDARLKSELPKLADPQIGFTRQYSDYSYLARGRYWEQLKHWYDVFSEKQIMLIEADTFFDSPSETYHKVLEFLGLGAWDNVNFRPMNTSGASQDVRNKIGDELYEQLLTYFHPHNEILFEKIAQQFNWD